MESYKSEMEAVQKRSREIENLAKKLEFDKTNLDKELETVNTHKARAENQITEMKSRISNLQQELDNSVAVQTDFVRLSQSLQMELEKIRQSEKEVVKFSVYFCRFMFCPLSKWAGYWNLDHAVMQCSC